MKERKAALANGNKTRVKELQKAITRRIGECKHSYKEKLERNFHGNNPAAAWKTMNMNTGYTGIQKSPTVDFEVTQTFVEELNNFYCRFDKEFTVDDDIMASN